MRFFNKYKTKDDNDRENNYEEFKWYKKVNSHRRHVGSSNTFAVNYLQLEDAGTYECEITNESGMTGRAHYELVFSTFSPKYGDDESGEGGGSYAQVNSEHEISFFYIETDVRPFGQVVVLCESSKSLFKMF